MEAANVRYTGVDIILVEVEAGHKAHPESHFRLLAFDDFAWSASTAMALHCGISVLKILKTMYRVYVYHNATDRIKWQIPEKDLILLKQADFFYIAYFENAKMLFLNKVIFNQRIF